MFCNIILSNTQERIQKTTVLKKSTPLILSALMMGIIPQEITYWIWLLSYGLLWLNPIPTKFPILKIPHITSSLTLGISSFFIPIRQQKPKETLLEKDQIEKLQERPNSYKFQKLNKYIFVGVISVIFIILYSKSNAVVSKLLNNIFDLIDLSFIEIWFFFFVGFIYMLLKGIIIYSQKDSRWLEIDRISNTYIDPNKKFKESTNFYDTVKLCLITVSTLLSLVNIIDSITLISGKLPQGVSHSEFVHQGFNTLIFSMILAMGLVMHFYKGSLNFIKKNKTLNQLTKFWIIQNIILDLLTNYKNLLYIQEYGFTYKRIFVFVVLILVIIALLLLIQKINHKYSSFKFINLVAVYTYIVLVGISLIPIDILITQYNLKYAKNKDITYI